ncbi:MAG: hypothetical protein LLG06_04260 [Desulfobacteraceae bacterium]|nr:hypothetical protein [Desulfobacteraceae bacterium]
MGLNGLMTFGMLEKVSRANFFRFRKSWQKQSLAEVFSTHADKNSCQDMAVAESFRKIVTDKYDVIRAEQFLPDKRTSDSRIQHGLAANSRNPREFMAL